MGKLKDAINIVLTNVNYNEAGNSNEEFCKAAKNCAAAASYKVPLKVIRNSNTTFCANCKNVVHYINKKISYCPYCGKAISWAYKVKR